MILKAPHAQKQHALSPAVLAATLQCPSCQLLFELIQSKFSVCDALTSACHWQASLPCLLLDLRLGLYSQLDQLVRRHAGA